MTKGKLTLLTYAVLVTLVLSTSCKKEGYILPVKPGQDSKKSGENEVQIEEASQETIADSDLSLDADWLSIKKV